MEASSGGGRFNQILGPLIQALACGLRSHQGVAVRFGRYPQHHFSADGLLWLFTQLLARCKVVIYRSFEFPFEIGHRISVKADDAVNSFL